MEAKKNIKSLELFSGAGGLALGIAEQGIRHEALLELSKDAVATLKHNFQPDIVHHRDVRDVDFGAYRHVDIVAGGAALSTVLHRREARGEYGSKRYVSILLQSHCSMYPCCIYF